MPTNSDDSRSISLSLSPRERWILHHVLLDRIEAEASAANPADVQPPPIAVFRAFETLDGGSTTFTVTELEAVQRTLAACHHSASEWVTERARIEQVLHRVAYRLEAEQSSVPAE